jgi:hypothetical protein
VSAVFLRLLAFLVVIAVGVSFAVFVWTRDRRWLRFAWQIVKYTVIVLLIVFALLALERLVLAA